MNLSAPFSRARALRAQGTAPLGARWLSARITAPKRSSTSELSSERQIDASALSGLASPPESLEIATAAGVKKANLPPKQVYTSRLLPRPPALHELIAGLMGVCFCWHWNMLCGHARLCITVALHAHCEKQLYFASECTRTPNAKTLTQATSFIDSSCSMSVTISASTDSPDIRTRQA